MSTRSNIAIKIEPKDFGVDLAEGLETQLNDDTVYPLIVDESRPYLQVYCHFDGYLSGVGEELSKLTDYEKIKRYIIRGGVSSIDKGVWTQYAVSPRYNEDWESNAPRVLAEPELDNEYLYVFKDGKWYVQFCYGKHADGKLYGLEEMLFEEDAEDD